jgi:hypothetical protein
MTTQKKHDAHHTPPSPAAPPPAGKGPAEKNEGEGSRSAARRYDASAERAAKDPKHVEEAAKKAQAALEGPEGDDLRAAEARAKKTGKPA